MVIHLARVLGLYSSYAIGMQFDETEFTTEKQRILKDYGITEINGNAFILDGEYISDNTRIAIKGHSYVFEYNGNVIKSGDLEYIADTDTVILKTTDGKEMC